MTCWSLFVAMGSNATNLARQRAANIYGQCRATQESEVGIDDLVSVRLHQGTRTFSRPSSALCKRQEERAQRGDTTSTFFSEELRGKSGASDLPAPLW